MTESYTFALPYFFKIKVIMSWFIDLGANWANTLTLYEKMRSPLHPFWTTVAFEASPLVQPFLRDYCAFLNGERNEEPENCLPRSGSTSHLLKYAKKYGCPKSADAGRKCMWNCLNFHLEALKPDPSLNSSKLIDRALQTALLPATSRDRYIAVPAAVSDSKGWTIIYENPKQLIRGGAIPSMQANFQAKRVHTVDVAEWLLALPPDAHVFLKMDIEGAEHKLVKRMNSIGSYRRINMVSIECHDSRNSCRHTMQIIRSWNVTVIEEKEHGGMDSRSISHLNVPIKPKCQCRQK